MRPTSILTLAAATSVLLVGAAGLAFAQTEAGTPSPAQTTASQPLTKEQKKLAKAQHKAERQAARAKNTAELKKLEDAGYRPAQSDPNYPQNLQETQKKANATAGGRQ